MSRLTYKQITELVNYNEKENIHFMPNEIFEDLKSIKKNPHRAFAYSYYYLVSWLYRNAKYGTEHINVEAIKELLSYSPHNKTINYIIKKGGILDELGYTETTSNYPISWSVDEFNSPEFALINETDEDMRRLIRSERGSRFTVKYPIKHMHIDQQDYDDGMKTGIYYDVSNTHMMEFDVFVHCMSIKELGATAFYLYGYLQDKNQKFKGGYDVSLPQLSKDMGMIKDTGTELTSRSLIEYLSALRGYGLVDVIHNQEYFSSGIKAGDRLANTYITNDHSRFTFYKQDYKRMDTKSEAQHKRIVNRKKRTVDFEELPFNK